MNSTTSRDSTPAIDAMIPPSVVDDRMAYDVSDLASSALELCKRAASLPDLESAITLLRALHQKLPAHPRRAEVVNELVIALLTRFSYDPQSEDLGELIMLQAEVLSSAQRHPNVEAQESTDPDEYSQSYKLALDILMAVHQSADIKSLDKAVSLHREILLLQPRPHSSRWTSLVGLAEALMLRFRHAKQLDDLEDSVSSLREAYELQKNQIFLLLAALLSKCNATRDLRTLIE
ncbi:hypothetical protein B0H10DRAFT_2434848, partial [Mycena sp. CBHHK59/15]